jgi:hypothetical protein
MRTFFQLITQAAITAYDIKEKIKGFVLKGRPLANKSSR